VINALTELGRMMASHGVERLYAKKLASNDNSKNQIYMGSGFQVLNIIPNNGVYVDRSVRQSKRDRLKANLNFYWLTDSNHICPAPTAQLILYPEYPEVRLSGFLKGCTESPQFLSDRGKGRLLFLGVTREGKVLGYAVEPEHPIARDYESRSNLESVGVFQEIPIERDDKSYTRTLLLTRLLEIHEKEWINSWKLCKDGSAAACNASNCGGYTLEAELGVRPNGYSEPDFHGWEVKQHNVSRLDRPVAGGQITLMTPEPTAGFYKTHGVEQFIRKFGYPDKKGRDDRMNFGGVYRYGKTTEITGLRLDLPGYNPDTNQIDNPDGGIALMTPDGEPAAMWKFSDLLNHWNKKHAQAVYVPSICQKSPVRQYRYGPNVRLGEGTDFSLFLKALKAGLICYDPGIKLENASTKPITKRRSQFRIKSANLSSLYHKMNIFDLYA